MLDENLNRITLPIRARVKARAQALARAEALKQAHAEARREYYRATSPTTLP